VKSRAVGRFWQLYEELRPEIRHAADKQFLLWHDNPYHRSLRFKQVRRGLWSARITNDYRVLATRDRDTWLWFWIGSHKEYERLLKN
jgi:hypothetical protein